MHTRRLYVFSTFYKIAYLPKTELIAKYVGVNVAEAVIANCSPRSVVENF